MCLTKHPSHCFAWACSPAFACTSPLSPTSRSLCMLLGNSLSPSLKVLFFLFSSSFRSLVIQGLLLGNHGTVGGYVVFNTEVNVLHYAGSHGVGVIFMGLTECILFTGICRVSFGFLWPPGTDAMKWFSGAATCHLCFPVVSQGQRVRHWYLYPQWELHKICLRHCAGP